MDTLTTKFGDQIKHAVAKAKISTFVTEHNVYQEGQDDILPALDHMVETLILAGSGVDGMENLEELFAKAKSGESCLLLLEHFSNLDLSLFHYLVRKAGGCGPELAKSLIAISGMKLNEDSPVVAALASAYTRIVICPSRSIHALDAEKDHNEIMRLNSINRASFKTLFSVRKKGKIVLVFPSGTRYRPWDPSTKRGVRDIDAYLRMFDFMCNVAINGQVLHVQQTDMMNDIVSRDIVRITAGPVQSCAEFRDREREKAKDMGLEDPKQATVDAIMAELDQLHISAEEKRQQLLK